MQSISEFWSSLQRSQRIGLIAGLVLIVAIVAGLGVWAMRPQYDVLFTGLATRDAASIASELDKLKAPYEVSADGQTIHVPKSEVHALRLKLMSRDVPLQGAVGFELFNNADFGMTEFVQKVNYQRALQGELTRTILSIDSVDSARVHLALPERGLFEKTSSRPTASVNLVPKEGRTLDAEQIGGIQRLVAASVPGMTAQDVTIIDHQGVALSKRAADPADTTALSSDLIEQKKATEDYLMRKADAVLERVVDRADFMVGVDAVLDLNRTQSTVEEVLPAHSVDAKAATAGVLVHERHTSHDGGTDGKAGVVTVTDNEYHVGKRVDQTIVAPGAIKRLSVAILLRKSADLGQSDKLRDLVGVALGLNAQRGDQIVIHSLSSASASTAGGIAPTAVPTIRPAAAVSAPSARAAAEVANVDGLTYSEWMLLAAMVVVLLALAVLLRSSRRSRALNGSAPPALSLSERRAVVEQVNRWLSVDAQGATPR